MLHPVPTRSNHVKPLISRASQQKALLHLMSAQEHLGPVSPRVLEFVIRQVQALPTLTHKGHKR